MALTTTQGAILRPWASNKIAGKASLAVRTVANARLRVADTIPTAVTFLWVSSWAQLAGAVLPSKTSVASTCVVHTVAVARALVRTFAVATIKSCEAKVALTLTREADAVRRACRAIGALRAIHNGTSCTTETTCALAGAIALARATATAA